MGGRGRLKVREEAVTMCEAGVESLMRMSMRRIIMRVTQYRKIHLAPGKGNINVAVLWILWHNPAIKRVDGNEYISRTVREPAVGAKQVSEADGKSSRSGELKWSAICATN